MAVWYIWRQRTNAKWNTVIWNTVFWNTVFRSTVFWKTVFWKTVFCWKSVFWNTSVRAVLSPRDFAYSGATACKGSNLRQRNNEAVTLSPPSTVLSHCRWTEPSWKWRSASTCWPLVSRSCHVLVKCQLRQTANRWLPIERCLEHYASVFLCSHSSDDFTSFFRNYLNSLTTLCLILLLAGLFIARRSTTANLLSINGLAVHAATITGYWSIYYSFDHHSTKQLDGQTGSSHCIFTANVRRVYLS